MSVRASGAGEVAAQELMDDDDPDTGVMRIVFEKTKALIEDKRQELERLKESIAGAPSAPKP